MKKGQVTIFIILGLMLLIGVAYTSYLYTHRVKNQFETVPKLTSFDTRIVQQYVESCLNKIGTEGVYLIASSGGYLNPKGDPTYGEEGDQQPEHYYLDTGPASYLVNASSSEIRSLSEINVLLNRYIAVNLPSCLDFSDLERQGYVVFKPEVDWEENNFTFSDVVLNYSSDPVHISSIIRLNNNDVLIDASYPLLFATGDESFPVTTFTTDIPLRLALIHKVATRLTSQIANYQKNQTMYKFTEHCVEYATKDKTLNIYSTTNQYALDNAIQIVDTQPTLAGHAPLRFNFGVRNGKLLGNCVG